LSESPSAVVFNKQLYCFHKAVDGENGTQFWYNVFDGANWLGDLPVPGTYLSESPSAAVFNEKLYCFHQSVNGALLWYNVSDGGGWSRDVQVPNTLMSQNPSAVVFNNNIFCFHQDGNQQNQLWCNVFDGAKWSGDARVRDIFIYGYASPSVAVFNSKLYCVHLATQPNQFFYTVFDGANWSADVPMPYTSADAFSSPSLAVFNNKLYCFHARLQFSGSQRWYGLWYSVFDGTNWSDDLGVPYTYMAETPLSPTSPAAVVFNNKLYCFFQAASGWYNNNSNELWGAVFDGTNWQGIEMTSSTLLSGSPSAAVFNNQLWVSHQAYENGPQIYYNVSNDGSTWAGDVPVPVIQMAAGLSIVACDPPPSGQG
jgi:hypothetical protein